MKMSTCTSLAALMLATGIGSGAMAQTASEPPKQTIPQTAPTTTSPPPATTQAPAEKMTPSASKPGSATATSDGKIIAQPTDTVLASELMNKTVYSPDQKKIGTINDLILKKDGSAVEGVVVGVGGFLGIGEKSVALTLDKLSMRSADGGAVMLVLSSTREDLEKAASFKTKADQEAETRAAQRPAVPTNLPGQTPGQTRKTN